MIILMFELPIVEVSKTVKFPCKSDEAAAFTQFCSKQYHPLKFLSVST
jgi:hypothetical protein